MTALAGMWRFDGPADAERRCAAMLQAQQIYAPDPPKSWADGGFAAGRRLFKLLPEDRFDRGPVVDAERQRVLVADVRLDDRAELARTLGVPEADERLMSDAMLLMAALDRWDVDAISRLNGDFAFALWDGREQRLLLARDFLGQRPLHFHKGADFFGFASMPKGLHALPEVPVQPDTQAVTEFLALMPEGASRSFFKGIERVLPGHYCIATRAGVRSERYWKPRPQPLLLNDDRDYEEAVRSALDRAVAARLRGAGSHVGSHLSGGLDSSSVSATAARLLGPAGRVTAFTSVPREGYSEPLPRGRFGDEGPLAAAVAALHPNIEQVLIRTEQKSPLAALDRNFFLFERPVLNLCNGLWMNGIMDAARQRGVTVMLTGQQGNMSFSYAGLQLLPELLRRGRFLRLARNIVGIKRHGVAVESALSNTIGPYLPAIVWRGINRLRGRRFHISDHSAVNLERADSLRAAAAERGLDFSYRPRRDAVASRLWAMQRVDLGNYNKGSLGGWGIDVRDPSGDRALVELCLAIPVEQYLHRGVPRSLARRAFADRLPEAVVRESRKGLQAIDWHEGLTAAKEEVAGELARIENVPEAADALETGMLRKLVSEWPTTGWNSNLVTGRYRLALLRGLSGGHFIRKAKGSNA